MWRTLQKFVEDVRVVNAAAFPTELQRKDKLSQLALNFTAEHGIDGLLSCLDTEEAAKAALAAQALSFIMDVESFSNDLSLQDLDDLLVKGLQSPNRDVRLICLRKIKSRGLGSCKENSVVANLLLESILTEDIEVAKIPMESVKDEVIRQGDIKLFQILVEVEHDLCNRVSRKQCSSKIQELTLSQASTAYVRLLSLIATIVVAKPLLLSEEVLQSLVDILKGRDILLKINIITVVEVFASFEAGLRLLLQQKLPSILASMTNSSLLREAALRVLGAVAAQEIIFFKTLGAPELFIAQLKDSQLGSDTATCNFLNVIAAFAGSSIEASDLFLKRKVGFLTEAIAGSPDVFVAGLDCIATMLSPGCYNFRPYESFTPLFPRPRESSETSEYAESRCEAAEIERVSSVQGKGLVVQSFKVFAATRQRTQRFGMPPANMVDVIFHYLKKPLEELQCACFKLLRALCLQRSTWGLNVVLAKPENVAFLMNRDLNLSKTAREWRFSVVEAVVNHPAVSKSRLASRYLGELQTFTKSGPFLGRTFKANGAVEPQARVKVV